MGKAEACSGWSISCQRLPAPGSSLGATLRAMVAKPAFVKLIICGIDLKIARVFNKKICQNGTNSPISIALKISSQVSTPLPPTPDSPSHSHRTCCPISHFLPVMPHDSLFLWTMTVLCSSGPHIPTHKFPTQPSSLLNSLHSGTASLSSSPDAPTSIKPCSYPQPLYPFYPLSSRCSAQPVKKTKLLK